MRYDAYGTRGRGGRWYVVPAALTLALILVAGGMLAYNYKHFGNLVKVVSLVKTQYLHPVDPTTMVDGAAKGIVNSLNDPYSVYLDANTFSALQEQIKGSFGGLGILVGVKDKRLTVVRTYQGTPAARAGVQASDVIVQIDERDATDIDLETAIGLMRGPVGSKINLIVTRNGSDEPLPITMFREEISVPTVEGRVLPDSAIGYVAISQFTERTPREMKETLNKLTGEAVKGLVLDLRDNPGGELFAAVEVAKNFIPRGPIVFIDYRNGKDQEYKSEGENLQLPLVVLMNGNSASASEILAGAVKDTGAGTLVGTKTFGKGIVQTVFRLENGAGLKLTTARYLTPAKNDIHEKGIQPDVTVPLEDRTRDTQLEQAVAIMKQKMAG
jgi:carboxyl-terminal processing protease